MSFVLLFCSFQHTESSKLGGDFFFFGCVVTSHYTQEQAKTNLTTFQFQFQSEVRSDPKKGGFICDFDVDGTVADAVQTIYIPFASCKEEWRGEPEGGAPTAKQLTKVSQIGIGAAGVAGTFGMALVSVSVAASSPGPAPGPSPPAPGAIELVSFDAGSPHLYTWTDL